MGQYVEPTHALIRSTSVKGYDTTLFTMGVKVHESVCKPHRTATLTIFDDQNIIEGLGVIAKDPASFAFQAPPNGDIYEADMDILSVEGKATPDNLKAIIYTIEMVDHTYYQDREQLVQTGHVNQGVSDAINQVHGRYLSSIGLSTRSGGSNRFEEAYDVTNKKPYTAIYDLAKMLSGGSYSKGNALYYRDRYSMVLASLEDLFSQMGSQESFIQKDTWGANFFDADIYRAIIYAEAKSNKTIGGRSAGGEIAATAEQGQQVFDYMTAKNVFSAAGGSSAGGLGGSPNIQSTNSKQTPDSNAPWRKTIGERKFSASSRGGPQIELQVPLQTGINVTVGRGITAQLLPSGSDMLGINPFRNSASGGYLVTDLVHALTGRKEQAVGTTTIEGIMPL